MKYILITTLTLSLTLPAHAMDEERQLAKKIDSSITGIMAKVTASSFAPAQKQALSSQLSTIENQHDTLTASLQKTESEQLAAALKALHQIALEKHRENLRVVEKAVKEDVKVCFFEPKDVLLESAKGATIHAINTYEKILTDYDSDEILSDESDE